MFTICAESSSVEVMMHGMALLLSSGGRRFISLAAVMIVYEACMFTRGQADVSVMSQQKPDT